MVIFVMQNSIFSWNAFYTQIFSWFQFFLEISVNWSFILESSIFLWNCQQQNDWNTWSYGCFAVHNSLPLFTIHNSLPLFTIHYVVVCLWASWCNVTLRWTKHSWYDWSTLYLCVYWTELMTWTTTPTSHQQQQ